MHSDKIVALAHEVASDPEQLAHFISAISEIYDLSLREAPDTSGVGDDGVLALGQIAPATGHAGRDEAMDAISATLADLRANAFTIDQLGIVRAVDASPADSFPVRKGSSVYAALADATSRKVVRDRLGLGLGDRSAHKSVIAIEAEQGTRSFWSFQVYRNDQGMPAGRFTELKLGGSEQTCDAFVEAFDLTATERELLLALVEGHSPRDFADRRGRSVETARTQVRSLLAKVGVSSQIDLIRLYAAAYSAQQESDEPQPTAATRPRPGTMVLYLEGGRRLEVQIHGPATGRPVIFLHNMFSGPFMTQPVIAALIDRNIRLICPWRAGFAGSERRVPPPKDPVRATVEDIEAVLDAVGIDKAPVIGCMSAAAHAVAAAAILPGRITNALCIAGFPPIRSRSQIDTLPPWPRLFAYTARYFPGVLTLTVRAVVGLLLKDRASVIYDGLYSREQADLAIVSDPAHRAFFIEDFARVFQQDTRAYESDAALAASDWSDYLNWKSLGKVRFLHGAHDPVTPVAHLTAAVGAFPCVTITTAPNSGQLVMFEDVTLTMDLLEEMLASTASDR